MSWKVSVLVNDETVDPTARTRPSWSAAKKDAEGYVSNAMANGFRVTVRDGDSVIMRDDDGDRVRIVVHGDQVPA